MGIVSKPFDWHGKGAFDLVLCQSPSIGIWTRALRRIPSRPFERGHQKGTQKICLGQILALFVHNSTKSWFDQEFLFKRTGNRSKGWSNRRSPSIEADTIRLRTIKENKVLIRKVLIGSNWSLRLARKADSKEGRKGICSKISQKSHNRKNLLSIK